MLAEQIEVTTMAFADCNGAKCSEAFAKVKTIWSPALAPANFKPMFMFCAEEATAERLQANAAAFMWMNFLMAVLQLVFYLIAGYGFNISLLISALIGGFIFMMWVCWITINKNACWTCFYMVLCILYAANSVLGVLGVISWIGASPIFIGYIVAAVVIAWGQVSMAFYAFKFWQSLGGADATKAAAGAPAAAAPAAEAAPASAEDQA
jgi:hypothetical protein